jgi:hypothetical protein
MAALLLRLNGGKMSLLKFVKLTYNIEREALNRWLRPVTFGRLFSFDHGQVVSEIYDDAKFSKQDIKSFWREYLETYNNRNIRIIQECGIEKLSRAEISLIKEMFERYKDKSECQMVDEHHEPSLFPEWKNPHGSSAKTKYSDLLRLLGKTQEEIKEFEEDLNELACLEKIAR